jgi:hypothetical protein
MSDNDLIREARRFAPLRGASTSYILNLADALEAANTRVARIEKLLEHVDAARAGYDALKARVNQLEKALREIASCKSRVPGDVVDIACDALAGVPAEPAIEEKPENEEGTPERDIYYSSSGNLTKGNTIVAASSVSAGAGQVPADTIEKAPLGFMCPACKQGSVWPFRCGGPHSRPGSKRLHYDFVDAVPVAALAAVRTPEEQT